MVGRGRSLVEWCSSEGRDEEEERERKREKKEKGERKKENEVFQVKSRLYNALGFL